MLQVNHTSASFHATFTLPGDKSISHRVALLAALSKGTSTLTHFLESEDCLTTLRLLEQLGTKIKRTAPGCFTIQGRGGIFEKYEDPLDCGNSGTTMRLLAGILAAQPFFSELIGDTSLSKRPMQRIIEPLQAMGATLHATGTTHHPPLHINGGALQAMRYTLPVASAQVKSTILLASLFATGETIIIEPTRCRDHTERLFAAFGIHCSSNFDEKLKSQIISLTGPQRPKASDINIPGDISSAAFWAVAAAARSGSRVSLKNVSLNPTRMGFLKILQRMGARLTISLAGESHHEPYGDIMIEGDSLVGTVIEGKEIPNVIDELPILAVAGALAQGRTLIKDAQELRVKETDRITALVSNLRALGADIIEHEDGLEIEGGRPLQGATLKSYGDHRIAMTFAIAGLFAEGTTTLEDTACVATSYPGFAAELDRYVINS